jgi:hypothetical protein
MGQVVEILPVPIFHPLNTYKEMEEEILTMVPLSSEQEREYRNILRAHGVRVLRRHLNDVCEFDKEDTETIINQLQGS